jgi:hypothetical protein
MRAADAAVEIDRLGETVTAFLSATGVSRRRFGVEAVGDPDFVRRLVSGRKRADGSFTPCDFQIETVRRCLRYISSFEAAR